MVNIRSKGQRGEREAAALVTGWLKEVVTAAGIEHPVALSRNLDQTRDGGYDLVGLDWLALEVKRHETLQVSQWWKQAVRQAKDGQVPVLMYRQNRTAWKFRLRMTAIHRAPCGHSGVSLVVADMDAANAKHWLQHEFWARLQESS